MRPSTRPSKTDRSAPGPQAWRLGLALVGVGVLVGLTLWIGPNGLAEQLAGLRWAFPFLLLLGGVKHLLRTKAWQQALEAEGVRFPLLELFKVRVGANGVAYLSSMGALLSDPLKPWLLRKVAPAEATVPATLVETALYWTTSLLVTTVGCFSFVHLVSNQGDALAWSFLSLSVSCLIAALLFTRTPVLTMPLGLIQRLRKQPPRWMRRLRKAEDLEKRMRSFRLRHPGALGRMSLLDLTVQAVMLLEVWMVLRSVGVPVSFAQLMAIEGASRLVKIATFYVPGRIGADEAGAAGSFLLFGLSPASGLALALARRAQALCWAAGGLVWLAHGGELPAGHIGKARHDTPGVFHRALREDIADAGTHRLAASVR